MAKKMHDFVKELSGMVREYSYEDGQTSMVTDEKVCNLLLKEMRRAKQLLFFLEETLYSLQMDDGRTDDNLSLLKTESDIFVDEVRMRYCEWKGMDQTLLEKLVAHDYKLITEARGLNGLLESANEKSMQLKNLRIGQKTVNREIWEAIRKDISGAEERIDRIVRTFKERESICNIKPLSLERTLEAEKERIRKTV